MVQVQKKCRCILMGNSLNMNSSCRHANKNASVNFVELDRSTTQAFTIEKTTEVNPNFVPKYVLLKNICGGFEENLELVQKELLLLNRSRS